MDVSRRQFFKICAGGMAGTTVAATPTLLKRMSRASRLTAGSLPGCCAPRRPAMKRVC
ncbi:hypothetical protein C9N40_07600 [Salmonella enterica subsp. enterica serovar Enteritidis]|nr:hypothetical protein [Salmonella enterica subsp. enterica serovar Enteritidis]